MIIPARIDIQLVNSTGQPVALENLLFGLKIFKSDKSWYNYSVFKTDAAGHITLTKQDIINNTELKFETNLSAVPTKFELYVWEGKIADEMIKMTAHLLALYNNQDLITQDLKKHNIPDNEIPGALEKTNNKAIEDRAYYEFIKDAVNNTAKIDPPKIEDTWNHSFQKSYKFVVR
jgi:hypothetical protein